jgi:hypothetical protein
MPTVPAILFDGYNLTMEFERWQAEQDQYMHETVYGFDPDYDPVPDDIEVDDDIPF